MGIGYSTLFICIHFFIHFFFWYLALWPRDGSLEECLSFSRPSAGPDLAFSDTPFHHSQFPAVVVEMETATNANGDSSSDTRWYIAVPFRKVGM